MKYLYALMDDEIRFQIAQQVGNTKYTADIKPLFKKGKQVAGKRPNALIGYDAPNFQDALNKKKFFTRKNSRTRQITHIIFQSDYNNHKMEHMNREV
jgi:hypothetical protein